MKRKFKRVAKDKTSGLPKKYVSGAKSKTSQAREIKDTARRYKQGLPINIKAVSKSRVAQGKNGRKAKKVNLSAHQQRSTFRIRQPSLDLLQANSAKFIDGGKVPIFPVDPGQGYRWRPGQEAESKVLSVGKGGARKADRDLMRKKK